MKTERTLPYCGSAVIARVVIAAAAAAGEGSGNITHRTAGRSHLFNIVSAALRR